MTATGEHTGAGPYLYRPDLDPANAGVPSWVAGSIQRRQDDAPAAHLVGTYR